MSISLAAIRTFFVALSILLSLTLVYSYPLSSSYLNNIFIGLTAGSLFGVLCIAIEAVFKRFQFEDFMLLLVGLVLGNFMGEAIWTILKPSFPYHANLILPEAVSKAIVFLLSTYFSLITLYHAAAKFSIQSFLNKKDSYTTQSMDVLLDPSALIDPRVVDLAASGILDNQLVLPRFILKDFHYLAEHIDEQNKAKGRAALDIVKKLEAIPHLNMRYSEAEFPDSDDVRTKLSRLAGATSAKILTAEMTRSPQTPEEIPMINMNFLSNALKPITQTGECLTIKIQRYGKEPRQGVGYLKDGTMVVVNGGAEFIGEEIKAYVLSVKHTASGRMIFCNAAEDDHLMSEIPAQALADLEIKHKNFFSI